MKTVTHETLLKALAPMQDVTDVAFLRVLSRLGSEPDLVVTPYLRSTSTTCAMGEGPLKCIAENPTAAPVWAQLAGSDAAPLVRDARELMAHWPIAGINLNAGCPSPLVNRHGAGAALLRELPRLRSVCLALRDVLPPGCFSIKCRLGWADVQEFEAILEVLAEAQPDMLMVHARTRRELYGGHPHREAVAAAVQRMECPVLANGDMVTMADAEAWLAEVHPAGLMIGRGAVSNPYLFRMLRGGAAPNADEIQAYFLALMDETSHVFKNYTGAGHCNRMKKYLTYCYAHYFSAEEEYALRRCTEPADMLRLIRSMQGRRTRADAF